MNKLFSSSLKIIFRDKGLLFWSIMFPLMFTFIFGFFFGKGNMNTGNVALINKSDSVLSKNLEKAMADSDLFTIQHQTDENAAKDLMKKNKVSSVIIIPAKFGDQIPGAPTKIKVISDPANNTTNSIISSFLSNYLTQADFQLQHVKPIFSVETEKTNTHPLNYFDFVLIGLLGMALMNSSIQGISITMAKYREDKILKRITTTPLASWKFIVSYVGARLILNIIQLAVIVLIGMYAFDAHIYGNWLVIFGIGMLGAVLFQLMGFAIAGFSKTTEAAEGMATAVSIPMMFLAGVFFPIDTLPKWLYSFVQYLPLSPLLRILRAVSLEGSSPLENPTNLIIVISWVIIMLFLASYKFRLNEE